jgi:Rieske Fe-S protein
MHRRRALVLFINSVVALVGGGLTAILGAFALRPSSADSGRWIRIGPAADLTPNEPVPRVLSVARQDGWYRARAPQTVFVVWDGEKSVRALSATCTHLGCQVRWDAASTRFRCPCHGGVFDKDGSVVEGPPPRALHRVDVRLDEGSGHVLVRL